MIARLAQTLFDLVIIPLALLVAFGCGLAIVSCVISIARRGSTSAHIAPVWALPVVVALSVTGLVISARALVAALRGLRSRSSADAAFEE